MYGSQPNLLCVSQLNNGALIRIWEDTHTFFQEFIKENYWKTNKNSAFNCSVSLKEKQTQT